MTQIIDAYLGLTALRQAGYRSTATAVAELVDNSIEADAQNIHILIESHEVIVNKRKSNQIKKIMVLDDGVGMSKDVLSSCLSLGWGTRLDTREGLGRFGFGLKGSSLSQTRRVEVFSWQNTKSDVNFVYMDLDEIKEKQIQELPEAREAVLPSDIHDKCKQLYSDSGTLVIWNSLDQLSYKTSGTLTNHINKELCRIYRHFLDDDDDYGRRRNIYVHEYHVTTGAYQLTELAANDPLYLLKPNNVPGHNDEATNEIYGSPIKLPVRYTYGENELESNVLITCTLARPEIQREGGNSPVGRHYKNNQGISFVRAGREIDFGGFGYLNDSDPRDRWWGIEVRFDPLLDEYFGVTNNKQEVRNIKKLDDAAKSDLTEANQSGDNAARMKLELNKVLDDNIEQMMRIIKGRGGSDRKSNQRKKVVDLVNKDIKNNPNPSASQEKGKSLSIEQKIQQRIQTILGEDNSLSNDDARKIAEETQDYRIDIRMNTWPGDMFLEREIAGSTAVAIINRNTKFYGKFWEYLASQKDSKGIDALEIIIMAYILAEDSCVTRYDKNIFKDFRQEWGVYVNRLIDHADT